jgi:hypothetical protein
MSLFRGGPENPSFANQNITFQQRFAVARQQLPMHGMLYIDGDFHPGYRRLIREVKAVCQREMVCAHGIEHGLDVANNMLILAEIVKRQKPTINIHHPLLQDATLVATAFTHDIGYGSPFVVWENLEGVGHEIQGAEIVRSAVNIFQTRRNAAAEYIAPYVNIICTSIAGNTDHRIDILKQINKTKENPSVENFFALILMAGDKFAFFIQERLDGIPEPDTYEENKYFWFAHSVRRYTIAQLDNTLVYTAYVDNNANAHLTDDTWEKEVAGDSCGIVFELGRQFAELLDLSFEVNVQSV